MKTILYNVTHQLVKKFDWHKAAVLSEFGIHPFGTIYIKEDFCYVANGYDWYKFKASDIEKLSLEYHRKPTEYEIKFGHGAIHYRDFNPSEFLKADNSIKKRIKAKNDGLIYTY